MHVGMHESRSDKFLLVAVHQFCNSGHAWLIIIEHLQMYVFYMIINIQQNEISISIR